MYQNLKAEMARQNISGPDIARVIHKTEKSARMKIAGKYDFSITECWLIRDAYFPGFSIEYLFERT